MRANLEKAVLGALAGTVSITMMMCFVAAPELDAAYRLVSLQRIAQEACTVLQQLHPLWLLQGRARIRPPAMQANAPPAWRRLVHGRSVCGT